ncbi:MAG TPA: MFS transporter, partial [Chitinophagaceae bacterium]|nr:MFS transporter [Chitinophagaceae bacterium]
NLAGGKLADRIGFYKVQLWSLFFNGVLFIFLGYMQTFWQIGASMFVIGIVGESFRPANAAAIAFYSSPANRTRSYSVNRLAINLGFSIGPAVGGILSYHWLFWVDGITCIIASIFLRLALPPVVSERKKQDTTIKVASSVWKDKIYLRFVFFIFLTGICFLQLFSLLPVYYKEHFHLSKPDIGLLLAMNGFVIVIVEMVLVFKLEGKRSPIQYIYSGAFLMGLSYLILNLPWPGLPLAVCAMLTITIGEMLMFPFVNTFWVSRSNEYNRAQYASVYSMSFACSQVLAPTFGAQVVQYSNYHVLWYVIFGLCAIASLGFSSFKKHYS